jgi:aryl-phospho-beta-D-glucosidase BglC (GH1 family)
MQARVLAPLLGLALAACDQGSSMPAAGECGAACDWTPSGGPPAGSPVERHGQLTVVDGSLVDQNGEPLQLRGLSTMWLNWENGAYSQNRAGLLWLRDNWKVSLVRAAMGIEPPGAYLSEPMRAKSEVHSLVQNAIELGLYVLIDWHDHHAEDHLPEARAFFEQFATLYGEYPNVIYEPYNEPLELGWSDVLKPYHTELVNTIRSVDPDNVIVLGTPQWSQRVGDAAADPVDAEQLMYTLHFYACTHDAWLRDDARAARAQGLPLFVTEWAATAADGGVQDKRICDVEAQLWHDFLNEERISWAAWKLEGCADASCVFRQGTPAAGPFDDAVLNGHGPFVRDRLLE